MLLLFVALTMILPSGWGLSPNLERDVQSVDNNALETPTKFTGTEDEDDDVTFVFRGSFDQNGGGKLSGRATINVPMIGYNYTGGWSDGAAEGNGTETSPLEQFGRPDQSLHYVGQFHKGNRHGKGEATYSWCVKGSTWSKEYKGDWINGQRHGYGECTRCDGSNYIGSWKNDKRNGQGRYEFGSGSVIYKGDVYVGPHKDNKFHGENGRYEWSNGNVYEGPWKDNKRHGAGGSFTFAGSRIRYVGRFENGYGVGVHSYTTLDGKTGNATPFKNGLGGTSWNNTD